MFPGNRTPSSRIVAGVDEVGRGCERPDAEVLTRLGGWKNYTSLLSNDEVLSYSPTGEILWQPIDKILEFDYSGNLIELKNRSLHIVVTPDHKFDVLRRISKRLDCGKEIVCGYKLETTKVLDLKSNEAIPRTGNWVGKDPIYFVLPGIKRNLKDTKSYNKPRFIPMDLWVSFLGIFLSEGSAIKAHDGNYRVHIAQKKPKGRKEIRRLLDKLPFNFAPNAGGFMCHDKSLWEYLRPLGKCYDKYIPQEFKDLSPTLLNTLIYWMVLGDGCVYRPKRGNRQPAISYYTSSKRLKDDFEEVALKAGWGFTTHCRTRTGGGGTILPERKIKSTVPCFQINLRRSSLSVCKFLKPKTIPYTGKVFCLSLPTIHNFLVRRNGRGYFTGNSLAGPVVAAAVILSDEKLPWIEEIRDSKELTPNKRVKLANLISQHSVWSIQETPAYQIDEMNILYATLWAMKKAVISIYEKSSAYKKPDVVLIDGNQTIPVGGDWLNLPIEQHAIVDGDRLHKSIGAASIIAKVYRDNYMVGMDVIYPEYGLYRNKGYGTEEHRKAIMVHGPCPLHRKTFKGVYEYLQNESYF